MSPQTTVFKAEEYTDPQGKVMNILSWTSKDCNWIGSDFKSLTVLEEQLCLKDKENQDLVVAMNSVVVHSRFVDSIDELFIETCDLSFMGFFHTQLEELFDKALRDTHQLRYIIAFPMVCTEFLRSTSPFAPEERVSVGEMSVNTVNFFLELIAKESKSVMGMLCEERVLQDEELAPSNGAAYYFKEHPDKLKKKGKNTQLALVSPGKESLCKVVDETSTKDLMLRNLVDLCFSLNCFLSILVWDHSFVLREYLVSHLEDLLMKNIVSMMKHNPVTFEIDHPSTVLRRIRSYISCLRSLELYVNIDMQRVLTSVLLQETQPLDSKGDRTIASDYTTCRMSEDPSQYSEVCSYARPSGWPKAMAPPLTLVLALSSPRSFSTGQQRPR
eukprot:Em0006g1548a